MPYRDPGKYRPPRRHIALVNRAVARLAALGLTPKNTVSLEVPGRRTGRVRRTSVVVAELRGYRYLVSLAGESEWVRNVRFNDNRASLRRRRAHPANALALEPQPGTPDELVVA